MPKIGAPKEEAERPYVLRCVKCGCVGLSRLVTRFTPSGTPAGKIYACDKWPREHRCDTIEHDGCTPERVYTDSLHLVYARTNDSTMNRHPGARETCTLRQCMDEAVRFDSHVLQIYPVGRPPYNELHNGRVEDCTDPRCKPTPGAVSLEEDMRE